MLELYQELIPLSQKKTEGSISQNQKYTNPVIMPYVLDSVAGYNVMESVLYIRNNDPSKYYEGVCISLMKYTNANKNETSGYLIYNSGFTLTYNSVRAAEIDIVSYSNNTFSPGSFSNNNVKNIYGILSSAVLVSNKPSSDSLIDVRFSGGYDELSNYDWESKKSSLCIVSLGDSNLPNTSYVPIRMRIKFKSNPAYSGVFTLRDYFIDVSYVNEGLVNAV